MVEILQRFAKRLREERREEGACGLERGEGCGVGEVLRVPCPPTHPLLI